MFGPLVGRRASLYNRSMSTTSKSLKAVLTAAHAVAAQAIPPHAHRFSPKSYTQHQVFACLVLKAFLKTDYRGVAALLADCPDLRAVIGLRRVPHDTTLQKASKRLLAAEATTPLLEATIRRFLARRRRVGIAAADATGLESRQVSPYFPRRAGRDAMRTGRYSRYPKLDILISCRDHLTPGGACRPGTAGRRGVLAGAGQGGVASGEPGLARGRRRA